MCADPAMMRLLAAELREEMAARKAMRGYGGAKRRWQAAACVAVACIALVAIL